MSLINLSLQHGRNLADAKAQLEQSVNQMTSQFGSLLSRVDWFDDRQRVLMVGTGFEVEASVDAAQVHLRGDMPLLGKLFGGKLLEKAKTLLENNFQKRLT